MEDTIFIGAILLIGPIIITIAIHCIYHGNRDNILKATKRWAKINSIIMGLIFIFFSIRTASIAKDIPELSIFNVYMFLILWVLLVIIFSWGIVHLMRLIIISVRWIAITYKERGTEAKLIIDNKYKYAGNSGILLGSIGVGVALIIGLICGTILHGLGILLGMLFVLISLIFPFILSRQIVGPCPYCGRETGIWGVKPLSSLPGGAFDCTYCKGRIFVTKNNIRFIKPGDPEY